MKFLTFVSASLVAVVLLFSGCAEKSVVTKYAGATESARLNTFFEVYFKTITERSPESMTALGINKDQDKLDDLSESFKKETYDLKMKFFEEMKAFDYKKLDPQAQQSYDIFKWNMEQAKASWKWRDYEYIVNHKSGVHASLPSFLIAMHQVKTEKDLENYIARLEQFERVFNQVIEQLKRSAAVGVIPPKFVFPPVLKGIQNLISGAPYDSSKTDSPLLKDFKKKLEGLKLSEAKKTELRAKGVAALNSSVLRGYKNLKSYLAGLEKKATADDGSWKFPNGGAFYSYRLLNVTTVDYTPDFVHKLGLINVDRIHGEMKKIMKQVKFKGDLNAFFRFMKTDKRFYFPQNQAGRQKYLDLANKYISDIKTQLPKMFLTLPKADLVVKPVEAFREKASGLAFYERAAPDGSRPGMYYVNLSNMKGLPTWEAEALAHHEALPGHHMQTSIAQEMKALPRFRRHSWVIAYGEGWGLYSEKLPVEFGAYKDPYSNFGRLSMELWRACRLVVDTGIHSKKWTRQKAIQYLNANTPSDGASNAKAIDRYIVWPGQATGYMVGMLKILELRRKAKTALGQKFDLRKFHDVVLRNGPVPLGILEKNVMAFIQAEGS